MARRKYKPKKRKPIPELDPVGIGRRVRKARKDRGRRQCDLAVVSGVDPAVVGLIENGIRVPSRDAGIDLAVALKRSLEWMYFGLPRGGKLWKKVLLTGGGGRVASPTPGTAV